MKTKHPRLKHPRKPMSYRKAIRRVERWLEENVLEEEAREQNITCTIEDYHDGDKDGLKSRPWTGVRVSEVDFSNERGGGSWMQVDAPWGIAVCGQVERCILALVEGWNENAEWQDDHWFLDETDAEFDRLAYVFELASKPTTVFLLNHTGNPPEDTEAFAEEWRAEEAKKADPEGWITTVEVTA